MTKRIQKNKGNKKKNLAELADSVERRSKNDCVQNVELTGRNTRFLLLAILLPVLALATIEVGLRLAGFGNDLALFVPAPAGFADRELLRVNPDVARRYFTEDRMVPQSLHDFFERKKPLNGYRVFVLGESVTAGFPYPGNVAFSRILQGRLADAYPDRAIEIVNVALTGTNSHAMVDFIDEILDQRPDAILVYAGHNEFYGALGVASTVSIGETWLPLRLYLKLRRMRIFQVFELGLNSIRPASNLESSSTANGQATLTLMGRMTGKSDIAIGDAVYRKALNDFEGNLRIMLSKAKNVGVPVLLSELISNQRDQPPFDSVNGGTPSRAEEVFQQAQASERNGRYDEARTAYSKAKDLDEMRFRAPEEFNEVIRQLGKEFGQVVVPMQKVFEAASPHGLVGSSLMLEHVHPNVEGQFLMSEAFLTAISNRGLLPDHGNITSMKSLTYYRENWPVSELDRALGAVRIRQLTDYWPFKPQIDAGREWANYRPEGSVEMLAYKVATRQMKLPVARIELAKRYQIEGKPELALREYRSMATDGIWDLQAQLVAAQQLIEARQFSSSLPFLQASLRLKKTDYAQGWIDRISAQNEQPSQKLK